MRKGESAAIQWTDVNLKDKPIRINKFLDFKEQSIDKDKIFGDVKSYHSKRTITISQA
ncbi:hypothetical protein [Cytobacillus purgationiresistens]|uniref:Uncharacterized protein n=1 Tax=Cytobacillus purgationiresistens TaxID=863449 RepID=A0ABU0ARA8_9BACI|nr:hypothetical protein [Cytobacillus purgationiresistens]MDQ0273291.1 hypothetical protein [Cytobacillus purgationiresistens]